MQTNDYADGFKLGYNNYRAGCEAMFVCRNNPPRVEQLTTYGTWRHVDPNGLDYARGYMDGFMQAQDDSHGTCAKCGRLW